MLLFKKIKYLRIIVLISLISISHENLLGQDWPKIYGDNYESLVNDINETYDNGFIISAFIYEPYGFNKYIWMIKTDINGEILWEKKLVIIFTNIGYLLRKLLAIME
jgi:hypothetical protein